MSTLEDTDIIVSQKDFDLAFRDLVPSVSQSEMDHYASIQQRFSRSKQVAVDGFDPSTQNPGQKL
jgi:peroxin-6